MSEHDDKDKKCLSEMTETHLGPEYPGLPPIPEPSELPSAYGIDEAVAIAIVPERALVFWELATLIEAQIVEGVEFRLIRLHLEGDIPKREAFWNVGPIGRFQDSGLVPGGEYLYVISRISDSDETPLLVTNPIRMPVRKPLAETPGSLPSSLDLAKHRIRQALKEEE